MSPAFLRAAMFGLIMLPFAANAEPIKLKLSFFTSDSSSIYRNSIKPFVDAVNDEGRDLINVEVYFSGAISGVQADQPKLVADGIADLALIVPGRTPVQFSDTSIMELPGIYRDQRQASLIFSRLIELGVLSGYRDFFVAGAFVSGAESIHSRRPIASKKDLRGLTIRASNQTEAATLKKLGAIPTLLAINQTTEAISSDKIDGATFPPSMVFEFGIGRVANNHYMIQLGGVPTALVMNRKKFESLPAKAQAIIRKFSGKWPAERSAESMEALDRSTLERLKSDPRRKVTFLSSGDLSDTRRIFGSVVEDWAALNDHNRELLSVVKAEIAKLGTSSHSER